MIYECENCETALGPGLMSCPRCGQLFDEPVPDDATLEEAEEPGVSVTPPFPILPTVELPPVVAPAVLPPAKPRAARRPLRLPKVSPPSLHLPKIARPSLRLPKIAWGKIGTGLVAVLIVAGVGWIVYPFVARLPLLRPAPTVILPTATVLSNSSPTDLAAHPGYRANMAEFVHSLQANGVKAKWPAFGSADTLLITPQTMVNGQRTAWTTNLYHELAQGIYADFVFCRYDSKFSDTDSTTCFVVVSDPQGKVVATDLMGNLK